MTIGFSLRRITVGLLFAASAVATSWASGEVPPTVVLERLRSAVPPSESETVLQWRLTTATVIEKTNGKGRHEAEAVVDSVRQKDGTIRRTAVRFLRDGEDLTEKLQETLDEESQAEKKKKRKDDDPEDDPDTEFVPPDDAHRDAYVFEPIPTSADGVLRCRFHPAPGHEKDEGIMTGILAWDGATLDPLWIEGDVSHPPKPLRTLHVRLEFAREGALLYTARMVTDGLAKVLLIKRRFHADMRFTNLRITTGSPAKNPTTNDTPP